MDHELERFKRINLAQFARSKGYQLDQRESNISCLVLRHPDGDKILTGQSGDGQWQYHSIRGPDKGTIIDFIQKREQKSLGEVREELRSYVAHEHSNAPSHAEFPLTKDRFALTLAMARAHEATHHPYLESHGLTLETLSHPRFRGTWKVEDGPQRGVVFPHHDVEGFCGFELTSSKASSPSNVGSKGIWQSHCDVRDTKLVVTERPLDAFSYHQLHPTAKTRYASVGRELNPSQERLVSLSIAFMTDQPSTIVAATSNDRPGHRLAANIREMAMDHKLAFRHHPPERRLSWSEALHSLCRNSSIRLRAPGAPELER